MSNSKSKTQEQIVDEFLAGAIDGVSGGIGNLKIKGNQLIHYQTVIAERYEDKVIFNHTRYSVVTGRIQKKIKEKVPEESLISVGKIPEGYKESLVSILREREVPADVG